LITGGSGLLGQYLNLFLSKENEILTLFNNNPGNCLNYSNFKIDLNNQNGLMEIFISFNPDIVIHTACFSRPEICDRLEENLVRKTNVEATKFISELCDKFNSKLIYTSTDLVYDGFQGNMLKENSLINPLSLYAKTKLEAEKEIVNTFDNYIILRTSLLFGIGMNHSRNNFHILYENLNSGKITKLFADQYRTPLSLCNASDIIAGLCKSDIKNIIFNFGGNERISRADFGKMLCEICGLDENLIEEISMNEIEGLKIVPDVSLNTELLKSYGFKICTLLDSIIESLKYIE
jgi:dTDP-4-dehydrorhamnose reductase